MRLLSCLANSVSKRGFLFGWETAFLGNCLTSYANLVAFHERTGVPTLYPHLMRYGSLFGFPAGGQQHICAGLYDVDPDAAVKLAECVDTQFDGYFPGYMRRVSTVAIDELPDLRHLSNAVLFLAYDPTMAIVDWRENDKERIVAEFCARGNGLILAGAFWNQYRDMRIAAAHGPALRRRLPILRPDGAPGRERHMQSLAADHLRIGLHVRRGDSRHWHGGAYFYELDDYLRVLRFLHERLSTRPHTFYVCSDEAWSPSQFDGLPVVYEQADTLDDFVALSRCHLVVGPPSTYATWSAFLGGARRLIITRQRLADLSSIADPLGQSVDIPFPTGAYLPGDAAGSPL